MKFPLLALILSLSVPAFGAPEHENPKKLTGTYSIGTSSLTDPVPGGQNDALLRLYLTGDAARDLYGSLRSKARRDECFSDGTVSKTLGTIMCSRHPKGTHECWIGVDLKRNALASAFVC